MDNKKIAVITGASRGIGESIADAFAAKGFDLILTARNAELLSHVSNRLESKHSNQVWKIPADLSTENGCTDFVRQAKELNLEIDVLVNNAGVFLPGTLMDEPAGQMEMQMQTAQAQLELLKSQAMEAQARAQKYAVEAQLEPEVVKAKMAAALSTNLQAGNADDAEFQKRAKIADLMLKEADIKSNERIAAMQVQAKNSSKNT